MYVCVKAKLTLLVFHSIFPNKLKWFFLTKNQFKCGFTCIGIGIGKESVFLTAWNTPQIIVIVHPLKLYHSFDPPWPCRQKASQCQLCFQISIFSPNIQISIFSQPNNNNNAPVGDVPAGPLLIYEASTDHFCQLLMHHLCHERNTRCSVFTKIEISDVHETRIERSKHLKDFRVFVHTSHFFDT